MCAHANRVAVLDGLHAVRTTLMLLSMTDS